MFKALLPSVAESSRKVLATALDTTYPKRQRTNAEVLQSTVRIIADVFTNGLKKQNIIQIFSYTKLTDRPHQRKLGVFRKGGGTPCFVVSAVLIFRLKSRVSSSPSCIPSPFAARSLFFHRRARVRDEDGPISLSHMPQNSTNRRLLPHAAPLTSAELWHLLPAKLCKKKRLLSSVVGNSFATRYFTKEKYYS